MIDSTALLVCFGYALSFFECLAFGLLLFLFDNLASAEHLVVLVAVVLCVINVAVGILSGAHPRSVVLARVLALVVDAGPTHGHHSDVFRHVLFAHEVAHIVFVAYGVFFVLLLLLLDRCQLVFRQSSDFP